MPRNATRARPSGALEVVRKARNAARRALDSLREEIRTVQGRLEQLVREERRFREDLFGAARAAIGGGARRGRPGRKPGARRGAARRRPPKAERYFQKLPARFTLDDVRKLAGRAAGVSIAQWTRARRIRKANGSYQKVK